MKWTFKRKAYPYEVNYTDGCEMGFENFETAVEAMRFAESKQKATITCADPYIEQLQHFIKQYTKPKGQPMCKETSKGYKIPEPTKWNAMGECNPGGCAMNYLLADGTVKSFKAHEYRLFERSNPAVAWQYAKPLEKVEPEWSIKFERPDRYSVVHPCTAIQWNTYSKDEAENVCEMLNKFHWTAELRP